MFTPLHIQNACVKFLTRRFDKLKILSYNVNNDYRDIVFLII